MKLIDIRNTSGVPQTCLHEGKLEVLGAGESKTMSSGLAEAFLSQCPGAVEIFQDTDVNEVEEKGFHDDGFVWLANMTGNPDLESEVTVEGPYDKDRRRWTQEKIPNPKLNPTAQTREFDLGEEEYRTVQGIFARNLGTEIITVAPYKRIRLPQHVAQWFLRRDGRAPKEHRGSVIVSRQKSSFEPDGSWELNDIKLWVSLIEPSIAGKIRTEEQCNSEGEVLEEKKLALRRSYFLAANPKYPLPSRAKFESLKKLSSQPAKFVEEEEDSDEVESSYLNDTPRKRGRPRKEA